MVALTLERALRSQMPRRKLVRADARTRRRERSDSWPPSKMLDSLTVYITSYLLSVRLSHQPMKGGDDRGRGMTTNTNASPTTGKNPTDEYLEGMMSEAPGPINFTMFLTMFGEKLNGTDPEDVIRNAFACFDEEASGQPPPGGLGRASTKHPT